MNCSDTTACVEVLNQGEVRRMKKGRGGKEGGGEIYVLMRTGEGKKNFVGGEEGKSLYGGASERGESWAGSSPWQFGDMIGWPRDPLSAGQRKNLHGGLFRQVPVLRLERDSVL